MGTDITTDRMRQLDASVGLVSLPSPEVCVICLDRVLEKAIALPCSHDQFDFPCLGTWLQRQNVCPLCKSEVKEIRYDATEISNYKIFYLPHPELPLRSSGEIERRRQHRRVAEVGRSDSLEEQEQNVAAVQFRRLVYQQGLYSLRVGTNKFSRYRNITSHSFFEDDHIASRARKWIRRELSVFEFLRPDSTSFCSTDRRASNAEFLLEYIVAILKSMEIRGSSGQAEELLKDFLGRGNARLFLHELEAWLRSPFERLEDWDKNVQYDANTVTITNK